MGIGIGGDYPLSAVITSESVASLVAFLNLVRFQSPRAIS